YCIFRSLPTLPPPPSTLFPYTTLFRSQRFAFNSPGQSNNVSRTDWRLMTSQSMPKKLRGKEITIVFKAGRQDGGPGSDVQMDGYSGLGMHLAFVQDVLDPVTQEDPA